MNQDTWEFVRRKDGTYAVYRNREPLCEGIPDKWFDEQICSHYGFCGQEIVEIRRQIEDSGKCVLVLRSGRRDSPDLQVSES